MKNGELWTKALVVLLVAALAGTAQAGLKAHWNFNENTGTTAADVTGHGYDATLSELTWGTGHEGSAIVYDGTAEDDSRALVDPADNLSVGNLSGGTGGWSLSMWVYVPRLPGTGDDPSYWVLMQLQKDEASNYSFLRIRSDGRLYSYLRLGGTRLWSISTDRNPVVAAQWNHCVVTIDAASSKLVLYVNGLPSIDPTDVDLTSDLTFTGALLAFGNETTILPSSPYGEIEGLIDDTRIYDHALTAAEVQGLVALGAPYNPTPANGATDVARDTNLSWVANPSGQDGGVYDVYFGTDPGAMSLVMDDTSLLSYDPPADLDYATTYYWRVDGAEQGNLWSFSTIPWDACSLTVADGDLDGDCLITLEDFAILANNWLRCGWVPDTLCP